MNGSVWRARAPFRGPAPFFVPAGNPYFQVTGVFPLGVIRFPLPVRFIPLTFRLLAAAIILMTGSVGVAAAQTSTESPGPMDAPDQGVAAGPVIGVDWVAPGDFGDAASDLVEIAEVGFTAVRVPPVYDSDFFTLADTLGLTLYIELPFVQLPSQSLRQALTEADSLLTLVLNAGAGHRSAGPIGITRLSDTRSTQACDVIQEVANRIRANGRQAYYTTLFEEGDRCADRVDFVLLDQLRPFGDLERLERLASGDISADFPRAGLAGIGASVLAEAAPGWSIPGSEEAQARYMETALNTLQSTRFSHVFVHRWRDQGLGESDLPDPWGRSYGLYTSQSDPRPSLQVVRGILRGIQDTFAFDEGQPGDEGRPWFPVLGWLMISLTALMYAGSPRFRSMIPRYFFAHSFFRNAVREAREVLPLTSTAILTVTGLSIGMIGSFIITGLQDLPLTIHWFRLLDEAARTSVTAILNVPFVLTVLIGSMTLTSTSVWMGGWMALTGRRTRLLPSQALMLASWPRWQVLILLPLAMTLNATPGIPLWSIILLALGWAATAFWATVRTTYDLYKITGVAPAAAALAWVLHPLVLGMLTVLGWSVLHWEHVRFTWHLLTAG